MKDVQFSSPGQLFQDRHVTRVAEFVKPWEGQTEGVVFVGLPLSKTSISHSGASFAPGAIRQGLKSFTTFNGVHELTLPIYDAGDIVMHPTDLAGNEERLEAGCAHVLQNEKLLPIFLGGDHGVTAPIIQAWQKTRGRVGIIQLDAHHDVRNTEDGGHTNGTPFRRLIENGALQAADLVQVGIREFANAPAYTAYCREKGIVIHTMDDIREKTMKNVITEALRYLSNRVDAIYLSFDMDVVDQAFAPGCPASGPGGITAEQALHALRLIVQHKKFSGMDIVEIDPQVDVRQMTTKFAAYCITHALFGLQKK